MITGFEISLYCRDLKKTLQFYIEELNLFQFGNDFGNGQCSIFAEGNPRFTLFISAQEFYESSQHIIFSINVDNIEALHKKYRGMKFNSGGELISKDRVFEYPAGRNITLKDPANNLFIIQQNFS